MLSSGSTAGRHRDADRFRTIQACPKTHPAVAHEMLEKLPLGKAHMMSFELIPIGPLNPLRLLQGMQPKP